MIFGDPPRPAGSRQLASRVIPEAMQGNEEMKPRKRNVLCAIATTAALACGLLHARPALAHGGVSMEKDMCVMKIESYKMHFTGYQPESAQAKEFCEDIPEEGNAIISLDQVEKAMRSMAVDFRIIRDSKKIGVSAQFEQLGGEKQIEADTVFYMKPAIYEHGSLQANFSAPKDAYIGIVMLRDPTTNQILLDPNTKKELISVFPFSMGFASDRRSRLLIIAVAEALRYLAALFISRSSGKRRLPRRRSQPRRPLQPPGGDRRPDRRFVKMTI
jgi:hypothetical protein